VTRWLSALYRGEGAAAGWVCRERRFRQLGLYTFYARQYVRALLLLITFVAWSAIFLAAGMRYALVLAAFGLVWRGIRDYGTSPLPMARGIEIHPALVIFAVVRIVWRRLQDRELPPVDGQELESPPRWLIP
jgi:hypothetical protein